MRVSEGCNDCAGDCAHFGERMRGKQRRLDGDMDSDVRKHNAESTDMPHDTYLGADSGP